MIVSFGISLVNYLDHFPGPGVMISIEVIAASTEDRYFYLNFRRHLKLVFYTILIFLIFSYEKCIHSSKFNYIFKHFLRN